MKANGHGVKLAAVTTAMRADLKRSGLTEGDMFVRPSLTDLKGRSRPGYVIRYADPNTGKPNGFCRQRNLQELWSGFERVANSPKYDQAPGTTPHIYFPKGFDWNEVRSNADIALFVTEGEKKAAAASKAGYATLGLGGVDCYKVKGKDELLPELAACVRKRKHVYLIYDSPESKNEAQLQASADKLAGLIAAAAEHVYVIFLPQLKAEEKTGLDDFLLAEGKKGFDALIAGAEEWKAASRVLRNDLLARAVGKCERILATDPEYKLFLHGTELVRVVEQEQEPDPTKAYRRPKGNTYLAPMSADNVELLLSKSGRVFSKAKDDATGQDRFVPADPKFAWARQVMANVKTFPEQTPWRWLRLVTAVPLILPDGQIVDAPGYHADTGVWFDPRGVEFPPVPEKPRKQDARKALDQFGDIFGKFPFVPVEDDQPWDETPSYAVVLATILDIVARHLLPTVPMLGVDAPEVGTGKTKLVESISIAATGSQPTRLSYDSSEEFDKHLPVALREGERTVLIDNIDKKWLNSSKLSLALTTDAPISFRVLGETKDVKVTNQCVVMATGNQLIISGDLPRRSLLCRLNANTERPEQRTFTFDPTERAKERFPVLVTAALTAMRYYFRAGCPEPKYEAGMEFDLGSFKDWSRRIRGLLVHLGFADPLATQKELREDNPALQEDVTVLRALYALCAGEEFLSDQIKKAALGDLGLTQNPEKEPKGPEQKEKQKNAREALRSAFLDREGRWNALAFGLRLRGLRDRRIDGLVLKMTGRTHNYPRYRIEEYR